MGIKLEKLIEDFNLNILSVGKDNVMVNVNDINRPGLQLAGYYNYFAEDRVQIVGKAEISYLNDMVPLIRRNKIKKYLSYNLEFIIIARGLDFPKEFYIEAKRRKIWLLQSNMSTTEFANKLTMYLVEKFAPETRLHGVLLDVYGLGILITGASGIGKSEIALELIKRGHRLISDDAVDIKRIEGKLLGSAPTITTGMLEVRGVGIIDVSSLYGMSSILQNKYIDLVISLEQYNEEFSITKVDDGDLTETILDVELKRINIPVKIGRNLAVIIEAAAVNYRHCTFSKITAAEIINQRINAK